MKKLFCLLAISGMLLFAQESMAQTTKKDKATKTTKVATNKGRVVVNENANIKKLATPEVRAQEWTDNMTKALSLNDEQRRKIQEINLNTAKELAEIKKNNNKRTDIKNAHAKREKAFETIFTAEQKAKFAASKKKMLDHHK
jgi:Spy/CpxP family protein refolding chaperone